MGKSNNVKFAAGLGAAAVLVGCKVTSQERPAVTAGGPDIEQCFGWQNLDPCATRYQNILAAVRGDDDRIDLRCLDDRGNPVRDGLQVLETSAAVAAMFYEEDVKDLGGGRYQAEPSIPVLARMGREAMCEDEPFASQPRGAWCGAVLVDRPSAETGDHWVMLAAEHCTTRYLDSDKNLRDMQFFFDNVMPQTGEVVEMKASERCVPAPGRPKIPVGPFLALIEVDCPAGFRRAPAVIADTDAAPTTGEVYAIGFPMRVPAKFSGWAAIHAKAPGPQAFYADLDIFPSNSSSPVFAVDHHLVGVVESDQSTATCTDPRRKCRHWSSVPQEHGERVTVTSTHDVPEALRLRRSNNQGTKP